MLLAKSPRKQAAPRSGRASCSPGYRLTLGGVTVRRITPATVTIIVGFGFVLLACAYLVKAAWRRQPTGPRVIRDVMIAIRDFPADYVLRREDIGVADLPAHLVPDGTIMERDELVGRRTRVPVKAFQPLSADLFYPPGGGPTLSEKLKPGYRAVTVRAQDADGLLALVRPGDRVDVLLTVPPNRVVPELQGGATLTLIQDVEVLAVDEHIDRLIPAADGLSFRTVTGAVTPEQANLLTLAKEHGRLQIVMRSPEDQRGPPPSRATLYKLLGIKPPEPEEPTEPAEQPKRFVAEIYRGSGRTRLEFDLTEQPARVVPGAGSVTSPPLLQRPQETTPTDLQVPNNGPAAKPPGRQHATKLQANSEFNRQAGARHRSDRSD